MYIKIIPLITLLTIALSINSLASEKDCSISFDVKNEKETYFANDTIIVLVKVELDDDFCDEAAEATKVFCKGLKICERSEWNTISKNTVGQKLTLTVLSGKNKSVITAYRKTGHYNCFSQIEFNVREEEQ